MFSFILFVFICNVLFIKYSRRLLSNFLKSKYGITCKFKGFFALENLNIKKKLKSLLLKKFSLVIKNLRIKHKGGLFFHIEIEKIDCSLDFALLMLKPITAFIADQQKTENIIFNAIQLRGCLTRLSM